MARPKLPDGLYKLVEEWCSAEQVAELLRTAKGSKDVRITAPTKKELIEKNLRAAVEAHSVPPERVYDLLREAEENGNQHIFYYRCKNAGYRRELTMSNVGAALWGKNWTEKMDFPRVELVENEFVFADFHQWNAHLKPLDWVLKLYGHEFTEKPTNVVEEVGDNRFTREFVREPRRIVIVVRWNTPDLLEIRVPQTESKKRVKHWHDKAWSMILNACSPKKFDKWDLDKLRRKMVDDQKKNALIYTCSTTRVLDDDHNVASFEAHDPQGHLFSSPDVVSSVQTMLKVGQCTHLRTTWLQGDNISLSRELNTLIGHHEVNEVVIGSHCTASDIEYVTNQLRKNGR